MTNPSATQPRCVRIEADNPGRMFWWAHVIDLATGQRLDDDEADNLGGMNEAQAIERAVEWAEEREFEIVEQNSTGASR